nr:BCCT family transporter [uncultured Pseudokineococcus sp.]
MSTDENGARPDDAPRGRGGALRRSVRRTEGALSSLDYRVPKYPHDTHPALVPGISIDEQRRRYRVSRFVLAVAGTLTVAFVVWGVTSPETVASAAQAAYDWATTNLGWMFNLVAVVVLVALLGIALSPYGKIPLGKEGEEPEFGTFSWTAMLFAAGLGVAVLFWGPAEPLTYFITPPPLTNDAETVDALHYAFAQTYFHWGFHAWAIYAVIGGAVGYVAYRRGRPLLVSSVFRSLFGARATDGVAGKLVDVFAIVATLFGTAAALGIAALQIGSGVSIVSGSGPVTNTVLVAIIAVLTACFIVSAVSGVARGIRYLSNTNILLTVGMLLVVVVLGPTLFLLNLVPSAIMEYLGSLFDLMGRSLSWGEETQAFQSTWTVYYWAWWISWAPFVGIFIARISRGRSIRQFLLGTIFIPSALIFVAYGVMGGTAISMYRSGAPGFSDDMAAPEVLFALLDNLPAVAGWIPFVAMAILAIFFITAADSASIVMGMLSTGGSQTPPRPLVIFWGLVMAGIAVVMLTLGEGVALQGLQQLVIVTAVPFALVLLLAVVAWFKELRTDPIALRQQYTRSALDNAVTDGIERYGDDFAVQVTRSEHDRGAGADVDSTSAEYTEWYQRRDEDGEPVGYDFSTGEWADGYRDRAEADGSSTADGSSPDGAYGEVPDGARGGDGAAPRPEVRRS